MFKTSKSWQLFKKPSLASLFALTFYFKQQEEVREHVPHLTWKSTSLNHIPLSLFLTSHISVGHSVSAST